MRYENLTVDVMDKDFLAFTSEESEGNVLLVGTDELIEITNSIRKAQGNEDLVGSEYDNEVYYNFYLVFDTKKKKISIQAVCNHGMKDDEVYYELPMTEMEEKIILYQLIEWFAKELYEN